VADPERLAEALDWFERAIAVLDERARALRAADEERAAAAGRWQAVGRELDTRERRLAVSETALAARESAVAAREELLRDGTAAHAQLTKQLEARTGAFERKALELEAALERLRAHEQAAAERAALLDERALAVSERGAQLDELARDLATRAQEVAAQGRDLERFAERVRQRDAELARAEEAVGARERRITELEVAAENSAWMLRPLAVTHREGAWTLEALHRLVAEHGSANPIRVEEWRAYLRYLHDFADVDGRLPRSFDRLIDDVFAPPPAAKPSASRG
jgi:chromosome segregation ATPase